MPKLVIEKYSASAQPVWELSEYAAKLYEEIQERAHNHFLERGGADGSALDDWFRAERETVSVPASELLEHDDKFDLRVALPGFEANQVRVMATPVEVAIRAVNSDNHESQRGAVHIAELSGKEVFRRIRLTREIDVNKTEATLASGMLRVVLPKKASKAVKAAKKKAPTAPKKRRECKERRRRNKDLPEFRGECLCPDGTAFAGKEPTGGSTGVAPSENHRVSGPAQRRLKLRCRGGCRAVCSAYSLFKTMVAKGGNVRLAQYGRPLTGVFSARRPPALPALLPP